MSERERLRVIGADGGRQADPIAKADFEMNMRVLIQLWIFTSRRFSKKYVLSWTGIGISQQNHGGHTKIK